MKSTKKRARLDLPIVQRMLIAPRLTYVLCRRLSSLESCVQSRKFSQMEIERARVAWWLEQCHENYVEHDLILLPERDSTATAQLKCEHTTLLEAQSMLFPMLVGMLLLLSQRVDDKRRHSNNEDHVSAQTEREEESAASTLSNRADKHHRLLALTIAQIYAASRSAVVVNFRLAALALSNLCKWWDRWTCEPANRSPYSNLRKNLQTFFSLLSRRVLSGSIDFFLFNSNVHVILLPSFLLFSREPREPNLNGSNLFVLYWFCCWWLSIFFFCSATLT